MKSNYDSDATTQTSGSMFGLYSRSVKTGCCVVWVTGEKLNQNMTGLYWEKKNHARIILSTGLKCLAVCPYKVRIRLLMIVFPHLNVYDYKLHKCHLVVNTAIKKENVEEKNIFFHNDKIIYIGLYWPPFGYLTPYIIQYDLCSLIWCSCCFIQCLPWRSYKEKGFFSS